MKKNKIYIVIIIVVLLILLGLFAWKYQASNKVLSEERKSYLIELNKHLGTKGIKVLDSCENVQDLKVENVSMSDLKDLCQLYGQSPEVLEFSFNAPIDLFVKYALLNEKKIDLNKLCQHEEKEKAAASHLINEKSLENLCKDISFEEQLANQFKNQKEYQFYVDCAKEYSLNLQQFHQDAMRNNLTSLGEDDLIKRFSDKPKTLFLMQQCSIKAENLYWQEVSHSNDQKDLEFCVTVLEECQKNFTSESCPTDYKNILAQCRQKLKK